MSAPRNPTGPPTGAAGSLPVHARPIRVRRLTGWHLTFWALVGARWSWRCADLACQVFPSSWREGVAPTWDLAMAQACAHARRMHPGTLTRPRPTGS